MPLYLVEHASFDPRLIYAKTARGATNHYMATFRDQLAVTKPTPIEAAALAAQGTSVETIGKGADVVMDNDPPEARRGFRVEDTGPNSFVASSEDGEFQLYGHVVGGDVDEALDDAIDKDNTPSQIGSEEDEDVSSNP